MTTNLAERDMLFAEATAIFKEAARLKIHEELRAMFRSRLVRVRAKLDRMEKKSPERAEIGRAMIDVAGPLTFWQLCANAHLKRRLRERIAERIKSDDTVHSTRLAKELIDEAKEYAIPLYPDDAKPMPPRVCDLSRMIGKMCTRSRR